MYSSIIKSIVLDLTRSTCWYATIISFVKDLHEIFYLSNNFFLLLLLVVVFIPSCQITSIADCQSALLWLDLRYWVHLILTRLSLTKPKPRFEALVRMVLMMIIGRSCPWNASAVFIIISSVLTPLAFSAFVISDIVPCRVSRCRCAWFVFRNPKSFSHNSQQHASHVN